MLFLPLILTSHDKNASQQQVDGCQTELAHFFYTVTASASRQTATSEAFWVNEADSRVSNKRMTPIRNLRR